MVDENKKKCHDCPENCPRHSDTCHVFCKIYKGWKARMPEKRSSLADDYCMKKSMRGKEIWRKNHEYR